MKNLVKKLSRAGAVLALAGLGMVAVPAATQAVTPALSSGCSTLKSGAANGTYSSKGATLAFNAGEIVTVSNQSSSVAWYLAWNGPQQGFIQKTSSPSTSTWTVALSGTYSVTLAVTTPRRNGVFNVTCDLPSNTPPACQDLGPVQVTQNVAEPVALSCSDVDGNTLTLSTVSNPAHGSLGQIDQSAQSVTYTPDANFEGDDSFTYKANDGKADSTTATVSIEVVSAVTCTGRPGYGSNSGVSYRSPSSGSWYYGGTGRDTLIGSTGTDCLYGGANNDTVNGGSGNDIVDGGDGKDSINPGAGEDDVRGGAGDDTIYANDGEQDAVECGDGDDTVIADRIDILTNCENVTIPRF